MSVCLTSSYLHQLHPEMNQGGAGCHGFIEANKGWAREKGYLK